MVIVQERGTIRKSVEYTLLGAFTYGGISKCLLKWKKLEKLALTRLPTSFFAVRKRTL